MTGQVGLAFPRSQSSLYWSRVGSLVHKVLPDVPELSQSSLYWSRVGRVKITHLRSRCLLVAILIVLEQGWKRPARSLFRRQRPVAILIVLEQGWKHKKTYIMKNIEFKSQSSLYWSRVGRIRNAPKAAALHAGRNPHCTGAGLEVPVENAYEVIRQGRNPHCTGAGLEDANLKWQRLSTETVAILIVLEQGWKDLCCCKRGR